MDRYALMALIPVVALFFTGLIVFSFTRLGRAIANRLEGRVDPTMEARIGALEATNEALRDALAEVHERLDFVERGRLGSPADRITTPV